MHSEAHCLGAEAVSIEPQMEEGAPLLALALVFGWSLIEGYHQRAGKAALWVRAMHCSDRFQRAPTLESARVQATRWRPRAIN